MSESNQWKCVCGALVDNAKDHQPACEVFKLHARECFCRGHGGHFEHEIEPQTAGHITVLWRCNQCPFAWVPLEVPARSQSIDIKLWMDLINPRLNKCRQRLGCAHDLCDLMIPIDEQGQRAIGSSVPPAT